MLNFSHIPFYDDHTHDLNMEKTSYTPLEFTVHYLHGFRDVLPQQEGEPFGVSAELEGHIAQFGVVKTMVSLLAKRFGCPATLEAVNQKRNEHLAQVGPKQYAWELYEDGKIVGCTADLGWPIDDPRLDMFHCRVQRLFQMDPLFDRLLGSCGTFAELRRSYEKEIRAAVRRGFIGIKSHVGERHSFALRKVTDAEAEASFAAACVGDEKAIENVYFAIFSDTLLLCQELDIPIHIHTGNTGGSGNGMIHNCDPLLMCPFLNNPEYFNTTIVFLHSNYPNTRNAALMAHMYPHVWVDLAWVVPWVSLQFPDILREVLGIAPHSKFMLGTGQHGIPEMAWISSKIARSSLQAVMQEYVDLGFLSEEQATESAELILHRNAQRLYHLD